MCNQILSKKQRLLDKLFKTRLFKSKLDCQDIDHPVNKIYKAYTEKEIKTFLDNIIAASKEYKIQESKRLLKNIKT